MAFNFKQEYNKGTFDPLISMSGGLVGNLINSNNYSTKAGNTVGTVGNVVGAIDPIIGAVLQVVGGGINAGFGSHLNNENIKLFNNQNNDQYNKDFDYSSSDSLLQENKNFNFLSRINRKDVGSDGWFSNKARKMTNKLNYNRAVSNFQALNNYANAGNILEQNNDFNALRNTFKDGGFMNTKGTSFPTGISFINEGGKHSENPNGGIQVGIGDNGLPNYAEEGEALMGNFVFSDSLKVPNDLIKKYKLKKGSTYAEGIKKISKYNDELANDPIYNRSLEKPINDLVNAQVKANINKQMKNNKYIGKNILTNGTPDSFLSTLLPPPEINYIMSYTTTSPAKTASTTSTAKTTSTTSLMPKTLLENLRYTPVVASGALALSDLFGITNKPNYSYSNNLYNIGRSIKANKLFAPTSATYLNFKPNDINYAANIQRAANNAVRRSINNQIGGDRTLGISALLQNNKNYNTALSEALLKSIIANNAEEKAVIDYNTKQREANIVRAMEAAKANITTDLAVQKEKATLYDKAAQAAYTAKTLSDTNRATNLNNFLASLQKIGESEFNMRRVNNLPFSDFMYDKNGNIVKKTTNT